MSTTPKPAGWNDPPKMEYSVGTGKPRRTLLNKRVAYPMSNASETSPTPEVCLLSNDNAPPLNFQILPPTSSVDAPRPVPLLLPILNPNHSEESSGEAKECQKKDNEAETIDSESKDDCEKKDDFSNSDLMLSGIMEKLDCKTDEELLVYVIEGIEKTFRICGSGLSDRKQEEISRKLDLFKEFWLTNQLPDIVKIRMTHLASALLKGHYEIANEIHLTLIVDHIAVVNQWMVAIKRIIQEAMKGEEEKKEM